ncbi:MAG TPA: type II toxin-antitoxin system HipA family toxin [Bacteroidia bacterium]|nr:type II toxin-antitoxin system HipA family toxin [Bacteroidia bacterium]
MNTAQIKLWGENVGAVSWDDRSRTGAFEFEPDFLKTNWDISPIMMSLAEARRRGRGNAIFEFRNLNRDTFYGLPGLLSDVLPDRYGTILINAWLASIGREPGSMNPVERLCYIGNRGMGALEFGPYTETKKERAVDIDIKSLVEMAQQILNQRKKFSTNIKQNVKKGIEEIIRVGSSAGGARAKAIIAYNERTGKVKSGQVDAPSGFEHWLIKFDGVTNKQLGDPGGYGRIELAYYHMALQCGIDISESRLLEENGRAHFMTKRFDRKGAKEKLHVQTLCGMQHYDFSMVGAYAYEQVFQTLRTLKLPASASEQLYRRMVFNVIARNQDDHTKNISFLMDRTGRWQLAPAYDVTYAYDPGNQWTKQHNLSINNKTTGISRADLLKLAKEMNVKQAKAIIEQVKDSISKWPEFAAQAGVTKKQSKAIQKVLLLDL